MLETSHYAALRQDNRRTLSPSDRQTRLQQLLPALLHNVAQLRNILSDVVLLDKHSYPAFQQLKHGYTELAYGYTLLATSLNEQQQPAQEVATTAFHYHDTLYHLGQQHYQSTTPWWSDLHRLRQATPGHNIRFLISCLRGLCNWSQLAHTQQQALDSPAAHTPRPGHWVVPPFTIQLVT